MTRLAIAAVALLAAGPPPLQAGPYTDLYVFGDSLSDVGNTNFFSGGFAAATPYFDGRFSNGPVYSEWLAEGLGIENFARSSAGGNNYAYGGALTSGTSFPVNFVVDDLDDQVDDFTSNNTPVAGALHVVLIGANDLLGGETNVAAPVGRVRDALDDLADAGAESFLVLNLPWLGVTPRHNTNPTAAAQFTAVAQDYNTQLAAMLDSFEQSRSGVDLFRLDTAALLNDLIASGADRGFSNVTESAAPGLDTQDILITFADPMVVPNPNEYIFWDDIHPTASVHRLLGFEAIRAVLPEGDYNRDGVVSVADYAVWKADFGSRENLAADGNSDGIVDAADYTLWRDALAAAGIITRSVIVPEPSTAAAAWLLLALGVTAKRPRRLERVQRKRQPCPPIRTSDFCLLTFHHPRLAAPRRRRLARQRGGPRRRGFGSRPADRAWFGPLRPASRRSARGGRRPAARRSR